MKNFAPQHVVISHFQHNIITAELSLHEFLKQAWPIIEGSNSFMDNWHIQ